MHIRYTETGKLHQSHSYRTKLVATTSKYKETFERIIPRLTCISTIRLAFLVNLTFFPLPLQTTLSPVFILAMTTRLFRENSMNAMLLKFSLLCPTFRSEAKRIMQIFKLSKHDYRSTSSRANPTVLAEWLVCNSHTVECYGSRIWPIVALEIM